MVSDPTNPAERVRTGIPTAPARGSRELLSPGVATSFAKSRMDLERGIGSPMMKERISDLDGASCSMSFWRGHGRGEPLHDGAPAARHDSPAKLPHREAKEPGSVCGQYVSSQWQRTLEAPQRLGTGYSTKMRALKSKGGGSGRLRGQGLKRGPASAPQLRAHKELPQILELDSEWAGAPPLELRDRLERALESASTVPALEAALEEAEGLASVADLSEDLLQTFRKQYHTWLKEEAEATLKRQEEEAVYG